MSKHMTKQISKQAIFFENNNDEKAKSHKKCFYHHKFQ